MEAEVVAGNGGGDYRGEEVGGDQRFPMLPNDGCYYIRVLFHFTQIFHIWSLNFFGFINIGLWVQTSFYYRVNRIF